MLYNEFPIKKSDGAQFMDWWYAVNVYLRLNNMKQILYSQAKKYYEDNKNAKEIFEELNDPLPDPYYGYDPYSECNN